MPVDFFEVERQLVARTVLDGLYSQPGIDVVPARAEQFLSKIPYEFKFLSKGKSRYVYAINVPQVIGIGLVLKLGGKHQNNLEVENTKKFPGDLCIHQVSGHFLVWRVSPKREYYHVVTRRRKHD